MPSGAAVVRYAGKRGVVWRIKYADTDGRHVMETLGPEREGWTERKAAAELRERLVRVERQRYRRPAPLTFGTFAERWVDEHAEARGLKRSTREGYRAIVERHLTPPLGALKLANVDVDELERYVALKKRAGLQPRTINRHLNVLSALFKAAVRRGLVAANPVALVEWPREPRRRWTILSPAEVGRVERASRDSEVGAGRADDRGRPEARRGAVPTSGPLRSPFEGDEERVFCHPETGGVLDHKRYAATLRLALAEAKIDRPMRPFHDGRHSSITNAAAAGTPPAALQARAGHSDYSTTQLYIDLAGETFREEAERLEERLSRYEAEKPAVVRGGRPAAIDTFATSRENRARLKHRR